MELNKKDLELIAKIDERLKHYKLITDNEQPITEQKERWKIEVYQPNITGDEGFKIHIEPTFKLRKPLAEQAAQAIRETLKNL